MSGKVFSSHPEALYAHLRTPALKSLMAHQPISALRHEVESSEEVYLIWFKKDTDVRLHSLTELADHVAFEIVADLADGTVYRLRNRT